MKPQVAVFTRAEPCTKIEIWNAMRGKRTFLKAVQIAQAQSIMGANAPRVMIRNGYLEKDTSGSVDVYRMTESGKKWLTDGVKAFLKNHPETVGMFNNLPVSMAKAAKS